MGSSGGGELEWRVNVGDGRTEILRAAETTTTTTTSKIFIMVIRGVKDFIWGLIIMLLVKGGDCCCWWKVLLEKAWGIGKREPKKAVHGLKVGLALTVVSILYYLRPLNEGVGGNAMWAIMTVVVTFESTVGATFYKCVNRVIGTSLAACLGIGVHWVAARSGDTFEPIILAISLFLLASATTFSRFIPSVKSTFDYGAMIFILTFCLVSISSYRVDKLFDLARTRLTTIAIGTSLCILVSMLFWPIWAGVQLHTLTSRNLDKLADALNGCVLEYFKNEDDHIDPAEMKNDHHESILVEGYKCVLNSKASEESMANFARWEPAHGRFGFGHPWKKYVEVGVAMRKPAYCIEALHGCLNSEIKAPECLKLHVVEPCKAVSRCCSKVLKELSIVVKTMKKSRKIDLEVSDMHIAVQQLQNTIKSLVPNPIINCCVPHDQIIMGSADHVLLLSNITTLDDHDHDQHHVQPDHQEITKSSELLLLATTIVPPLIELLPLATLVSLLIETASRIQHVVNAVQALANVATFEDSQDHEIKNDIKKPSNLDNAHVATRVFPDQA